jgi:uncharacterized protein DUF1888
VPDQTVNVSFNPTADPQFTFDPDSVTMSGAGKIILQRRPPTERWTFTGGDVKNDTLNEFSSSVQGNGRSLHIDDKFRDRTRTEYEYTITVELNGERFESPDPVIVNDPGR